MKTQHVMEMVFQVIGGLGIFLIGMNYMSDGMQRVAGGSFRKMINIMTSHRIIGIGVGTLMTCIVQSSSITTVMVVGLVNSELMNLSQAVSVIMGANIGTTITGWILAVNIGKYGLPILGGASFFWLFSKNEKIKYIALAVLGIGLIFFGLELMKDGFKPIRSMPAFIAWFQLFDAGTYWGVIKCALVGCLVTCVVQSSSATLGITIGLASTGVIPFETAAALVLGENIGTTITAFLATLGAGITAKRAAYFHILFNVVGVIWITAIFRFYAPFIAKISELIYGGGPDFIKMVNGEETFPYITAAIATVHTGFNVTNTLIFFPFTKKIARMLGKIGKEPIKVKDAFRTHLDFAITSTPTAALEQSRHEIIRMEDRVRLMMDSLKNSITQPQEASAFNTVVFESEDILDHVQKEITTFLTDMLVRPIPHEVALEGQIQLRMADEYESASDEITTILKLHLRLRSQKIIFTGPQADELLELHDDVLAFHDFIHDAFESSNFKIMEAARQKSKDITDHIRKLRNMHWERLSVTKIDPLISTTYMDIASAYRRIKNHLLNIAEAMCGAKVIQTE